LVEHNHAGLTIGGGEAIAGQGNPILHGDILKVLTLIQGLQAAHQVDTKITMAIINDAVHRDLTIGHHAFYYRASGLLMGGNALI
jgi:hypothetical protein